MNFKHVLYGLLIAIISLVCLELQAQDNPSGYTTNYKLRMYAEGAYASADSLNQNLVEIDLHIKNRDRRIDSLKTALSVSLNFPGGTLKSNVVGTANISDGAITAADLNSNILESVWTNVYFKKVYDDVPNFVGYGLKTDLNQFDNDTLKIKPNAVMPPMTFAGNQTFQGRILGHQGSNVASASLIELGSGNYFVITGTTNVEEILSDNWTSGSVVILEVQTGFTFIHGTGADGIQLAGATNFAAGAGDILVLRTNGTSWKEISRTEF